MFTGIIEEVGRVRQIKRGQHSAVLTLQARTVLEHTKIGDSIAVNGICLTVTQMRPDGFSADVMHETLERSALTQLTVGSSVNLERAMPANGRFGGHIVAGHVDGVGHIAHIRRDDTAVWYTILAAPAILRYVVEKGSVTIDGISLTVAAVDRESFSVSTIPIRSARPICMTDARGSWSIWRQISSASISKNCCGPSRKKNAVPSQEKCCHTMDFRRYEMMRFSTIEEALEDLRQGKIILATDDPDRENEGDFICAAEFATTENINFMATHGKGLICMPMSESFVKKLKFPQMVPHNTDNHETAFTVSIDHISTSTGISAAERSVTALACVDDNAKAEDFRRPGHMFPLLAKKTACWSETATQRPRSIYAAWRV